jgi:hypothetical protein
MTIAINRSSLFLLCCCVLLPSSVAYYSQVCPANKIVELVWNATSQVYEYQQPSNDDINRTAEDAPTSDATESTLRFRECNCPRTFFQSTFLCPGETSLCGIPVDLSEPILCFKDDTSIRMVRNVSAK